MPNAAKNEVETKPLMAASVGVGTLASPVLGAGVVWSGVGTFMVARGWG